MLWLICQAPACVRSVVSLFLLSRKFNSGELLNSLLLIVLATVPQCQSVPIPTPQYRPPSFIRDRRILMSFSKHTDAMKLVTRSRPAVLHVKLYLMNGTILFLYDNELKSLKIFHFPY